MSTDTTHTLLPPAPLPVHGLSTQEELWDVGDALPEALFTTDLAGRITYWNAAAERLTGFSRAEALGQRCTTLAGAAPGGCGAGRGGVFCARAQGAGPSSACSTLRTKAGAQVLVVKNAVGLHGPGGELIGALETFTDVGHVPGLELRAQPAPALPPPGDFAGLIGRAAPMQELYRMLALVAHTDATVMVVGETGTGKERVAEAIHRHSARRERPLVRVNCSALNENLLETELFGHVRGAFTGATKDRRGRFEEADGGTLLLDEIGDVSPRVQVKLLRVLEQREIERVGDSKTVRVDVRLVCATHRDLRALVARGEFRADLYFRLNVFPLHVPALREHLEDLPLLAEHFLAAMPATLAAPARLSPQALEVLGRYRWPGNVRELHNVLEYAAVRAEGADITPAHLPPELVHAAAALPPRAPAPHPPGPHAPADPQHERQELRAVLDRCHWRRTEAARLLGISRVTLWKRMKRLGLLGPDASAS